MKALLLYINWNPDPVFLNIAGNFSIRYYGLLWVVGILLSYLMVRQQYIDRKIDEKKFDPLFFYCFFGMIIGARLGHCLFYEPEYYMNHVAEMFLPVKFLPDGGWKWIGYQGLASHGGVIAIISFVIYYTWRHKINFLWLLDRLAIAVPIAAAFVRCGNLMNHEIVGSLTTVPWAFDFTMGGMGVAGTFRHPAQLYESAVYFLLFIGLVVYYFKFAKGKVAAGRTSGITLTVIFIARFVIEFFKEVQVSSEMGHVLNNGQKLSIPLVLLGLGLLIYSFVKTNYPECPYKEEPVEEKKKK